MTEHFPSFLASSEAFAAHLYEQFDDSTNQEKGDRFLDFAIALISLLDRWKHLPAPQPSKKKTHDKGVDFEAVSNDGTHRLCGQSKFRIRGVADIDEILSKFENYEKYVTSEGGPAQTGLNLDPDATDDVSPADEKLIEFVVVTPTSLEEILTRYERSSLSSRPYYDNLRTRDAITFLDRDAAFPVLRRIYRQNYVPEPEMCIEFSNDILTVGNVLISTVSGKTLGDLYRKHGSSLFFENIREFLGIPSKGKSDDYAVNAEIIDTLTNAPGEMLSRNNGITVKAEALLEKGGRFVRASKCSIVNGCQTTMCVVHAGAAAADAQIVIKLVEGGDPWEIAKAANYQNRVSRLELELAEFLRPQLVRKAATDMGLAVAPSEDDQTISNLLSAIYKGRVSYEFIRVLYLGIFSRTPKNIFNSNYSEVRIDILRNFAAEEDEMRLLRVLFELMMASNNAIAATENRLEGTPYESHFKRFFDDARPKYQGILAIMTACACTGISLAKKEPGDEAAFQQMRVFVAELERILVKFKGYFQDVFCEVFMIVADRILSNAGESDSDIPQLMYRITESSSSGENFNRILGSVQMRVQAHGIREKYGLADV
jgi:hypothetical protein